MDKSIRKETRQKFDMLLKNALKRKENTKSRQSLLSNDSSNVEENDSKKDNEIIHNVQVDVHDNKTYIMDKFLNDTNLHKSDDDSANSGGTFVKAPIPKPRRKKGATNSVLSNETYKIEESSRKTSLDSGGTYCVEQDNKKIIKEYDSDVDINTRSDSSNSLTSSRQHKSNTDKIMYENEIKKAPTKRSAETKIEKAKNEISKIEIQSEEDIKYSYEKIMGIVVHRTDFLKLGSIVIHPIIKIHIVNGNNGEYLKKTDDNRSIVFHYDDKKISYILPILTQPYDMPKKRMLYPLWEETILVNEDFNYITHPDTNAILFFELIDFMSFSTARTTFSQKGFAVSSKTNGWHKIAWAFLKIVGKNNVLNIDKKARLQFYVPYRSKKQNNDISEPYIWWKSKKLQKYPSTLYVTVKGINPQLLLDTFSLKHKHKEKRASLYNEEDTLNPNNNDILNEQKITWDKLLHKKCQLPNVLVKKLETYDEGCFIMKFDHAGRYLAYSIFDNSTYTTIVYSIEEFEETLQFPGHQSLIHSINWSENDKILITASADCTVCIWDVEKHIFLQMLPHPSFVYSAEITSNNVIVTGCYDQILRLWKKELNSDYVLSEELKGHNGYITSICCNKKANVIYSSDSTGVVIQWQCIEDLKWALKREIAILDIKGVVINHILLHKREKRLLIHSRDNNICLYNLKSGFVIHWLRDNVNNRIQTRSCFSNCGTFIFSGSENNIVNVWNAYTGKLIASYYPYSNYSTISIPIHCVDFHSNENILSISHYGKKLPILLYKFENDAKDDKVNFKLYNTDISNRISDESMQDKLIGLKRKQTLEALDFKEILNKMDAITANN